LRPAHQVDRAYRRRHEAFAKEEIGVGHALLLAKLQPAEQEQALSACFREDWNGGQGKPSASCSLSAISTSGLNKTFAHSERRAILKDRSQRQPRRRSLCRLPQAHRRKRAALRRYCRGRLHRSGLLPVQAGRIRSADHHSQAEAGTNFIGLRTGHNRHRQRQRCLAPK